MQSCPRSADDTVPPDPAGYSTTIPSPPPDVPPEELAMPPMPLSSTGEWAGFASADLDEQDGDA